MDIYTMLNSSSQMVIIFSLLLSTCLSFGNDTAFKKEVNQRGFLNFITINSLCKGDVDIVNCSPIKESMTKFTNRRDAVFLSSVFLKSCNMRDYPLENVVTSWELWKIEPSVTKIMELFHYSEFVVEEDNLGYGTYKLKLIVNIFFKSINVLPINLQSVCYFEMVDIGMQTIIYGGYIRSVNYLANIYFEVTTMLAPARRGEQKTVKHTYFWTCSSQSNETLEDNLSDRFCKDFKTSERHRLIKGPLASKRLTPDPKDDRRLMTAYFFTLFTGVHNIDRQQMFHMDKAVSQIMHITDHPGVNVGITCLLNCGGFIFKTNSQNIVHLEAKFNRSILGNLPSKEIKFVWLYQTEKGKPNDVPQNARSNDVVTENTELRIKSGFLRDNMTYIFHFQLLLREKTIETAQTKIYTSPLPTGFTCTTQHDDSTVRGLVLHDIFCSYKAVDIDSTSPMFEFYNKNNNDEIVRHLGYSLTGNLHNVLLTRQKLYVRATNLFGSYYEKEIKEISFGDLNSTSQHALIEEIDIIYGYHASLLHNYQFRIHLISGYWDVLSNSNAIATQHRVEKFNYLINKFMYELPLTDITDAILVNSVVSNIVHTINDTSTKRFFTSHSIRILARLLENISLLVKQFTANWKQVSRLMNTNRLYDIANDILKCSNFVLDSKENYNLLESTNRNNLKKSIFYTTTALKNILASVVSYQSYALKNMVIESKLISFRVLRLRYLEKESLGFTSGETILKLSPTPKLHLNIITFKINPFWWSNGYKINTYVKIMYPNEKTEEFADTSFSSKTIPFELKTYNFNHLLVTGKVKQPNLLSSVEIINKEIAVHRFESEEHSLSFINFTYIQNNTDLKVVILQGLRPDYDTMTSSEARIITTNSSVINFMVKDIKENEFLYIGILPGNNSPVNEIVEYNFTIFSAVCRIWKYNIWTTSMGCFLERKSSEDLIICNCPLTSETVGGQVYRPSHLFNPFFDYPILFSSGMHFPSIIVVLVAIFFLYLIVLLWSRKKDFNDKRKMNVILLDDNFPNDKSVYLVGVFTGARIQASTTSNIGFKLLGENGCSRSHVFNCLQCPVFKCNSDNWFILFTPHHLGPLINILLWIDLSGQKPNWYCSKIQVYDMINHNSDIFLIESWFGMTAQELHLQMLHECATHSERNRVSRIMSENVLYGFMESHYLVSVFFKHPRSPVTRAQRLSVVVCGILVNMSVCILLIYPTSPDVVDFSSYITIRDMFIIGMIGSLAECVVSLIMMHFLYSSYSSTDSPRYFSVNRDFQNVCHFKQGITSVTSKPRWISMFLSVITSHVRRIKALPLQTETHYTVGFTVKKRQMQIILVFCIVIMISCSHIMVICSLQYDRVKMFLMYTSIFCSFFQTNFIISPLKIFITAILLGYTYTLYYELVTFSLGLHKVMHRLRQKYNNNYKRFLVRLRKKEMYKPLSDLKIKRLLPKYNVYVFQITVYYTIGCICFLCVILWLIQLFKIRSYFVMNMEAFCVQFGSHELCERVYRFDLDHIMKFWDNLPKLVFPFVFATKWYNGDNMSLSQEISHNTGWLKNGESRLIGVPRLRQIRVKPPEVMRCYVPKVMRKTSRYCDLKLSANSEDKEDYGLRWSNDSTWDIELFDKSPWKYTDPSNETGMYLRSGSGRLIHNGGYVAFLHRNLVQTEASLLSLFDSGWIDDQTRILIVDFTMYNANNNVFTVTHIIAERLPVEIVKVIFYFRSVTLLSFVQLGLLFCFTFVVFFLQVVCLMNISGTTRFLRNFWDLFDCLIIIVFVYTTIDYCRWMLKVSHSKEKLSKQGKDVYFSIEDIIEHSYSSKKVVGVLFSLMLFRFLRIIKFDKDVKKYAQDLLQSRTEVFYGALISAVLMFIQFRLIMFLINTPLVYSVKDILVFLSQFKYIVRKSLTQTIGKVLAFLVNFTSQFGVFTFMLSQYHHFKRAQEHSREKERDKKRTGFFFGHLQN